MKRLTSYILPLDHHHDGPISSVSMETERRRVQENLTTSMYE